MKFNENLNTRAVPSGSWGLTEQSTLGFEPSNVNRSTPCVIHPSEHHNNPSEHYSQNHSVTSKKMLRRNIYLNYHVALQTTLQRLYSRCTHTSTKSTTRLDQTSSSSSSSDDDDDECFNFLEPFAFTPVAGVVVVVGTIGGLSDSLREKLWLGNVLSHSDMLCGGKELRVKETTTTTITNMHM